jgi:hypothetical protein
VAAVLDEHLHRVRIAQLIAGGDRVPAHGDSRIVVAQRDGHAALRVAGIALLRVGLGQYHDAAGVGEAERGP